MTAQCTMVGEKMKLGGGGWSGRKMQQPTINGRGDGGWWLQSCRLMGDNTMTRWGGQEQDATRGKGEGESKLVDVRWRCCKRQHSNQLGKMRGKLEVSCWHDVRWQRVERRHC
jgi:hypothetical protein